MSDTQQTPFEAAKPAGEAAVAASAAMAAPVAAGSGSLPTWVPVSVALLTLSSLAGVGLAWQSLSRQQALEQELVKRQTAVQADAGEARALARQSQDLTRDTAAKVALLDARLAEVSLQRGQLEELIQSMSRSRDENVIGDIEASIRVALQQSTITGSAEPLIATLRQADERLLRYKQPRMEGVRRAVSRDLDRVKAVSVVDISTLTIKLDEVVRLLDELPLLSSADSLHVPDAAAPREEKTNSTRKPSASVAARAPDPADGVLAQWWWQAKRSLSEGAGLVWGEARTLLRVTRIDHPEAALLTPDQSFFLRENLKLRLLNARLALLSRQFDTAQADLRDSQEMLGRYFDARSRKVASAADLMRQVAGQARQVNVPRPDDTLAALTAAAAGR
ncbi:uroporphyrinogen-III C-methyltransferase [Paucibacter sp. Y2R2-4]|uniref:uroporphyrinogen-III C-methyltransferase n=1 Tax=Paucibacter sp. Y2R2-4 TaxID=2893553 RepID=UPI0021E3BAC0|nr:uroporphyrinogen-III C-methyltransferase [Paucibacter sp. Y2R2-4]MCV2351961.1 uroporphyrinogen-III C-methyltransferase [Paucibacter sp. Y2R2-4]